MPSVSKKQHNLMAAVAKNPQFAKKVGIKPTVGEHFLQADKGKKFRGGGMADVSRKSGLLNYETYKKKGDRNSTEDVNRALNNDFGPLGYDAQDMLARAAYKDANKEAANELSREAARAETMKTVNKKKGGKVSCGMKKGGAVRGCGCAVKGKTKGRMV